MKPIYPIAVVGLATMAVLGSAETDLHAGTGNQPPEPTPTIDFLPAPTLPADPTEADRGAYEYWLYCMACHGNAGQGLTDEFRALYPPSHQNCWESGCHGPRPYENGFSLPDSIPPVIAPGMRDKFGSEASLFMFVSASMPWQAPASLSEQSYKQIAAYLARENGLGKGAPSGNETPLGENSIPTGTATHTPMPVASLRQPAVHTAALEANGPAVLAIAGAIGLITITAVILWKGRKRS